MGRYLFVTQIIFVIHMGVRSCSPWFLHSVCILAKKDRLALSLYLKRSQFFLNVAHVFSDLNLVLRSDHCFLSSFKAVLKWYFALLPRFTCRIRFHTLFEGLITLCDRTQPSGGGGFSLAVFTTFADHPATTSEWTLFQFRVYLFYFIS